MVMRAVHWLNEEHIAFFEVYAQKDLRQAIEIIKNINYKEKYKDNISISIRVINTIFIYY